MPIPIRFSPWQPVMYDGEEYVVYSINLRVYRAKIVERYYLVGDVISGNARQCEADVSHISPVEAPPPHSRSELFYCQCAQLDKYDMELNRTMVEETNAE